jgi:hypothetical protein
VANPEGWVTAALTAAGAGIGAAARGLVSRWRNRKQDAAVAEVHEATAADTLVGTAMRLLTQLQLELESVKEQLGFCRAERRLQEDVLTDLREIVARLTEERDSLQKLLDEATRPR